MPVPHETKLFDLRKAVGILGLAFQLGSGHQVATVSEWGHCCFLAFAQV